MPAYCASTVHTSQTWESLYLLFTSFFWPGHSSGRVCLREKKRYREVMSTSSLWWWWWLSEMLCALNSLYYFPLSLFALCTLLVILLLPTPVHHCHWLDLTGPHRTKFFPFWTLNGYPKYLYYFALDDSFWIIPSGACLLELAFWIKPL